MQLDQIDDLITWINQRFSAPREAIDKAEMMALVFRQPTLVRRLMETDKALREVTKALHELEDDRVARFVPTYQVEADVMANPWDRTRTVQVDYMIDPVRSKVSVPEDDIGSHREGAFERYINAFTSHFDRKIAPHLKDRAIYSLAYAVNRSRV